MVIDDPQIPGVELRGPAMAGGAHSPLRTTRSMTAYGSWKAAGTGAGSDGTAGPWTAEPATVPAGTGTGTVVACDEASGAAKSSGEECPAGTGKNVGRIRTNAARESGAFGESGTATHRTDAAAGHSGSIFLSAIRESALSHCNWATVERLQKGC